MKQEGHIVKSYDEEIKDIKNSIVDMGSLVEKQLKEFMDAKGPQGGAAIKTKRKVEGVSEKNLTRLREILILSVRLKKSTDHSIAF